MSDRTDSATEGFPVCPCGQAQRTRDPRGKRGPGLCEECYAEHRNSQKRWHQKLKRMRQGPPARRGRPPKSGRLCGVCFGLAHRRFGRCVCGGVWEAEVIVLPPPQSSWAIALARHGGW